MASKKAWYWLAAGVLALGLNSEYQSGKFQFIHRALDHSMAVADAYARCAGRYLAQAHLVLSLMHDNHAPAHPVLEDADVRNVLANEQVEIAAAEAEMARQEVEQRRSEIQEAMREMQSRRSELEAAQRIAIESAGRNIEFCPGSQHIRVAVPQVRIPQVSVTVPQIHVAVPRVNVQVPAIRVHVPQINVAPIDDDTDNTL